MAGRRRKDGSPAVPRPVSAVADVGDVSEVSAEELAKSDGVEIDRQLREWVSRENPESLTVLTYVYRYDNPTTGESKQLCDRVEGDIPDPHTIGQTYGSGRYMLMVSIPQGVNQDRAVKALRFRLHPRYDDMRRAATAAAAGASGAVPAALPVAAVAPASGLREGLEVVGMVLNMLRPLLESQRPAVPDMSKLLEGQYDMMASVLKRSLADSQELIGEVQRARLEGQPREEDGGEESGFMDRIMPLVDRFLPVLLGGGAAGKAAAAAVSAMPEVKRVMENTGELRRVVTWLDKRQGREKTDRVLAALRVRRPHNGASVRARVPAGVPALSAAAAGRRG